MAKEESVFLSLLDRIKRGRVDRPLPQEKTILTGSRPNPESTPIQQKQQDFLDVQSQKIAQDIYSRTVYYDADRIGSYNDYRAMDMSPEVSAALDIITDEAVTRDERGNILTIYSENNRIKTVLKDLFKNRLNIEYNLTFWIREMIKFGDCFIKLEVDQKEGIYDVRMLPVAEIHREEAFDGNINSSRFKWDINNMYFEEFQIAHFRLVSDGTKIPYGRSILDPARKLWKQLQLAEDAMLVYRIIRAPERRVHYIEVGNLESADVLQYIEKVKAQIKKSPIVDQKNGQMNLKFNPLPVWKETPIPLLDGRTITIEELAKEFENGKENFVFSVQDKTHKIVPGKVVWCGKNYTAQKLTKVWLDDNTWVLTAPEHPFVLRDGSYVFAENLKEGDSLMPFYEGEKKVYGKSNYKTVYNPNSQKYEFVHRLISEEIAKDCESYNTVHHKDFNKFNNRPDNLEWVDFYEHKKMHSDLAKKMWENDEYKEKMRKIASESQKNRWKDESYRKKQIENISNSLKNQWKNKERDVSVVKKTIITYNKSESKRKKVSLLNKERNSISAMSWYNNSDLHKEHNIIRSASLLKRWNDKEASEKLKNSMKVKTNVECFNIMIYTISNLDNYINFDEFTKKLSKTNLINELYKENPSTKRDLNKFFHRHNILKILKENNINSYREFIKMYNPNLISNTSEYKNHKVLRIEDVYVDGEDVYCMTVVGLKREDDRHNFALYSFDKEGKISNSGVFVRNTMEEDYFVPIRGDKSSRIETLPGASNLGEIQDVEYLQNKLFAALKVPKTYLNYSETMPGGSTLSQADLRFSRTINRIQENIVIELRRIANIHLFLLGFEDDMDNFDLKLTNPSTQQELLKLETMKARLEVFKEMFTGEATSPVSYTWAMEYIMGFSKTEIKQILRQKKVEKKMFSEIETAPEQYMDTGLFADIDSKFKINALPQPAEGEEGAIDDSAGGGDFGGGDLGGGGFDLGGGEAGGEELGGGEETIAENVLFEEENKPYIKSNITENLVDKNKNLNTKTKRLVDSITERLDKINKETGLDENGDDTLNDGLKL